MTTTIKAILLTLAVAGWTFAACDRHAGATADERGWIETPADKW